jgi:hypothetical protein
MKSTYLTINGILKLRGLEINSYLINEKTFIIDSIDFTEEAYFIEVSFPHTNPPWVGNLRLDRVGYIDTTNGERVFNVNSSVGIRYKVTEIYHSQLRTEDAFIETLHKLING